MLGEIHEELVFPYPIPSGEEADKVRGLVTAFRDYAADHIDSRRIDEEAWIPDEVFLELGERGLMGLYVPEEYGGQGLSQSGYARGFEAGERYQTMGLRGNDLRPLYFHDVRVPPENLLGEPGEGFRIAMDVLNNGRLSLGTGSVGLAKRLVDLAIDHVTTRRQFGRPLADFDMVEDKIGWMVSYLFGLESLAYLTTGLVDAGLEDYSIESAIAKVIGTEFVWYQANRALQLKGGAGYLRDEPYEQILRDIRVFPIFEGANDVMRSFIALSALKPLGEELQVLADTDLADPLGTLGAWASYVGGRLRREVRPDSISLAHETLSELADPVAGQVKRLRSVGHSVLREHGSAIVDQGMTHKRLAAALSDVYGQIAVLSRVTSIFEEQGVEASGQERFIADTFCRRAAHRVEV